MKEREIAFRPQKSSRGRFLPQKERYYFMRKEKIIFAGAEKRFRALPLRRGTGQKEIRGGNTAAAICFYGRGTGCFV